MPRRRQRPPGRCMVAGCGAAIAPWKHLCDGCWRRLPYPARKAIAEAGQARAPHIVVDLCRAAAADLARRAEAEAALAARMIGEGREQEDFVPREAREGREEERVASHG